MDERISAIWRRIKNIRQLRPDYDEFSSVLKSPFKRQPSLWHLTPGMLTDLSEPETAIAAMPSPSPDRDTERALIARAQRGDVGAFEALYHANAPRIYALALRLTGARPDAAELTQDVFVRAWQRLTSFRGDAAFASWLHRIAINQLFMRARGERRRAAVIRIGSDSPDDAGAVDATPEEGAAPTVDVGQALDLERAIAALPPGARRVFVLHDVVGYRHDEIARLTGLAEGTLRAQLHRARKLLMEALDR
jgi:RNA polymerase sigma-70 factor (ECF subfamily)